MKRGTFAFALLLLTSDFLLLTSAQQPPVFRAGASLVRVDVIVTHADGQPVMDLQPEDFELTEDGAAQTIQTFKLIEVNNGLLPGPEGAPRPIRSDEDEAREAARDDVRLIGIFLDDYHVRRDPSRWARIQLAEFIETGIVPSDMVGVMYPLDPIGAVRFTRNHAGVREEMAQFLGRKGDYDPVNEIERGYVGWYTPPQIDQIRYDVSLGAIKALITRLGGRKQGRKTLILVSEGYVRAGTTTLGSSVDLLMDLREIYELANRNNVSIDTVDPRGLVSARSGGPTEALRMLSLATDGASIINRNDIAGAMRQMIREANVYYLLGYATTAPADGKFHDVRVRVRRPGVRLRYRDGYWAPTREQTERLQTRSIPAPRLPAVEAALATVAAATRARTVRMWMGADRGNTERTRLTFVWEPLANAGRDRPASVSLTVAGRDGTPYFRGRVPADAAPGGGGLVSFDVASGDIQLRYVVEGSAGEALDSDTRDFAVPDLTGDGPIIATPIVFRAQSPREIEQIKVDARARPTTVREFRRTERLLVRVVRYAAGPADPVSVRLLNRGGQFLRELAIEPTDAGGFLDFALAALEPGDYVLELTAASGDAVANEFVGFRVIG